MREKIRRNCVNISSLFDDEIKASSRNLARFANSETTGGPLHGRKTTLAHSIRAARYG
jgi:hypothetical protein